MLVILHGCAKVEGLVVEVEVAGSVFGFQDGPSDVYFCV